MDKKKREKQEFLHFRAMIGEAIRNLGGWGRNRTGVHGFAIRCMTTLPPSL